MKALCHGPFKRKKTQLETLVFCFRRAPETLTKEDKKTYVNFMFPFHPKDKTPQQSPTGIQLEINTAKESTRIIQERPSTQTAC